MKAWISMVPVVALAAILAAGTLSLTACKHEGPGERAGEKIDKAAEKVRDAVDPPGPLEKAGRKIDRAVDD